LFRDSAPLGVVLEHNPLVVSCLGGLIAGACDIARRVAVQTSPREGFIRIQGSQLQGLDVGAPGCGRQACSAV
jgi:hypothetical protein